MCSSDLKLIPGLLNDPSVELRRDAVQRVMDEGAGLKKTDKADLAQKQYRITLDAARDIDQIKKITAALQIGRAPCRERV